MNQYLPYIFAVSLFVLTIIMTAVGIQLYLVLKAVKGTVSRINSITDQTEAKVKSLGPPFRNLVGIAAGVKTGVKIFEGFVSFLNKKKNDKEE